jgi:hypothetical protein
VLAAIGGEHPGAAIGWRSGIALVPTILGPLPSIAQHGVKPEWVRREGVYIGQIAVIEFAAATIAIGMARTDGIAHQRAVVVPARAAYSHSASLGSR